MTSYLKRKSNLKKGTYFFTYELIDFATGKKQWYIVNPYEETSRIVNLSDYGITITGISALSDVILVENVAGTSSTVLLEKEEIY